MPTLSLPPVRHRALLARRHGVVARFASEPPDRRGLDRRPRRRVPASRRPISVPSAIRPDGRDSRRQLAWAAGSLYARPPRVPRSLALSAGMSLTVGGILLLFVSWGLRELTGFSVRHVSTTSIGALLYLVVFGSLVAFSAYSWLLRVAPPARVATHAYVNPLVAIALGSMLAGEPLTATMVAAGLVIASGVAIALAGQSHQLECGAHADA